MTAATRTFHPIPLEPTLFVAFELGQKSWKLGFTIGLGQRVRERNIAARDTIALIREFELARKRFKLPEEVKVVCCYEAGREGFWLHRHLESIGITCLIIDSSSIETPRRMRRAKTDRLDVQKLAQMLCRYSYGDKRVWSVVRVPTPKEEDRRHLHRELMQAKKDRTRLTNRIKGLLTGQGLDVELKGEWLNELERDGIWDGSRIPPALMARVRREWRKVLVCNQQITELEDERRLALRARSDAAAKQAYQLLGLKGIGVGAAWTYTMEFFAWRRFKNRREIGALAGLTPTPFQSGDSNREQGISKAGNRHVRGLAIEIAWGWLRFQPKSKLSKWYWKRFGHGGKRLRKIGIVALARKLLVDLWRYLETGALPPGAELKPTVRIT